MVFKLLVVDPDACTGCRVCELVCSFYHTKEFNPERSRIRIIKDDSMGINVPMVCQQCEKPLCVEACPVEAIQKDEQTGVVTINEEKCIGCKLCVLACPFGGTSIDPELGLAIKCDLCGGDPQCAKYCITKAISYVEPGRVGYLLKKKGAERLAELIKIVLGEKI